MGNDLGNKRGLLYWLQHFGFSMRGSHLCDFLNLAKT